MKVSIFSFAVNDKFPIDIMYRQFKKYMKEDFELILFNDAMNSEMEKNINTVAEYNNIKCVRVPQNIHIVQSPSEGYAATLNWALHNYAVQNNCETVVLIHSDIFPICEISMSEILGNYTVAGTTEFRKFGEVGVTYIYPAFVIINMNALKKTGVGELNFGLAPGVDTGGQTKNFIAKYPDAVKFLPNYQAAYFLATLNESESLAQYFKEDLEISKAHGLSSGWIADGMYHYMAGSQWNSGDKPEFYSGHQKRMDLFLKYFY